MPSTPLLARKYTAFISYRHADNVEEGRRWADWLHQTLESYEVPSDLVGKPNELGQAIPSSLYPVFRDEAELPADADLAVPIRRALENSSALIVICSPQAAQSRFVAEEIRYFKELRKAARIYALIVEGEPNAALGYKQKTGISPEQECFPEPLRTGVSLPDGSIDWEAVTEPIAADVRPGHQVRQGYTGAAVYRAELEKQRQLSGKEIRTRVDAYGKQLSLAQLKIIAGLLVVPLGTLTKRDQAFQLAKANRRQKILVGVLSAMAVLLTMAIAAGLYARTQQSLAQTRAAEALHAQDAAEQARVQADLSAEQAKSAQKQEEMQRKVAEAQKLAAQTAQSKAEESAAEANRQKSISLTNLARANMQRALTHLVNHEWEAANSLLKSIPKSDRFWEWRLLSAWCGPSTQTVTSIAPEGPYKQEIESFRKLAVEADKPEDSRNVQETQTLAVGKLQPFVQLYNEHASDETGRAKGIGWTNKSGSIVAGKVPGGGRPGILVAILRGDLNARGTLIDTISTCRYGEVSSYIPSQDGSMLYYAGDAEGGDGSYGEAKSKRTPKDYSLFPLGDLFGRTWEERKLAAANKEELDDTRESDLLDLTSIGHPNQIFQRTPENMTATLSASAHEFWFEGRPLTWDGTDPLEAQAGFAIAPDSSYRLEANAPAHSSRAVPLIQKIFNEKSESDDDYCTVTEVAETDTQTLLLVSSVKSGETTATHGSWEAWDCHSGSKLWSRPDPLVDEIAHGESATHVASGRVAVYPAMEILDLATGKLLSKLQGSVHVEGGAWFSPSLYFTPNGRFLVFFGVGRNDREFAIWDATSGKQMICLTGSLNEGDNAVAKQIGDKIPPYVLGWERSGKYIVLQRSKDADTVIYDDLGGKEIARFSGLNLNQNWYAIEPLAFAINTELDRMVLGQYLIKPSTWEVLLEMPKSLCVSRDWTRVAVPADDEIEVVRVPQDATPVSLREHLMMKEFDW